MGLLMVLRVDFHRSDWPDWHKGSVTFNNHKIINNGYIPFWSLLAVFIGKSSITIGYDICVLFSPCSISRNDMAPGWPESVSDVHVRCTWFTSPHVDTMCGLSYDKPWGVICPGMAKKGFNAKMHTSTY